MVDLTVFIDSFAFGTLLFGLTLPHEIIRYVDETY